MRVPLLTFCLIGLLPAALVIFSGLWGSLWNKYSGHHSYSDHLEIGVLFVRLKLPGTFVASLPYALIGLAGLLLVVFALSRLINPPYFAKLGAEPVSDTDVWTSENSNAENAP